MRATGLARSVLACLSVVALAGCGADQTPTTPSPVPSVATPTVAPTTAPTVAPTATPAPTTGGEEQITEPWDSGNFSNSATIDNAWLPIQPGTRWTWEGSANVDGERLSRRVITAVTDLTKVIDGVEVAVAFDQDITDGVLQEAELAFFAQDKDGTVWRVGEYPEEYEDGEFVEAPFWLSGLQDARAGIAMQANPRLGTFSYSQGWGPQVGWTDRARIFETGSETCVPFGCYKGVLVIDEFNRDSPDAHQLKYYASGVGNVRVGWAGALESEQEVLELTNLEHLDAAGMDALRKMALALEAHAYVVSPDVYGTTQPLKAAD
jgi:hypothetical protein